MSKTKNILFIIFSLSFLFSCSEESVAKLSSQNSEKIEKIVYQEIKKYPWYETVSTYESKNDKNFVDYRTMAQAIQYLAEHNAYEITDSFADITEEEMKIILSTLQNPKVQKILSQASPYDILNGKGGNLLAEIERDYQTFCKTNTSDTTGCKITKNDITQRKKLPKYNTQ